jgi:nucleotide-binding universal stress UspA family protein
MYRSLLVPLDGSPFAEQALPLALSLARREGAALQLVMVVNPLAAAYLGVPYDPGLEAVAGGRKLAYLDDTAQRVREVSAVPVSTAVLEGAVPAALCAYTANRDIDLVVMGTHGRGPLGRFWLGSVADELVRRLPVPVLLVRPAESEVDLAEEPKLGPVLVPLDGSPLAEEVLALATDLARLLGVNITLLRIVKPVRASNVPDDSPAEWEAQALLTRTREVHREVIHEASAYLLGVAERLRTEGLRVGTRVTIQEHPAAAILSEADATDAGLIALTTHGRRGLARVLMGSVADKVVRGSAIPVLVHRAFGVGSHVKRSGLAGQSKVVRPG